MKDMFGKTIRKWHKNVSYFNTEVRMDISWCGLCGRWQVNCPHCGMNTCSGSTRDYCPDQCAKAHAYDQIMQPPLRLKILAWIWTRPMAVTLRYRKIRWHMIWRKEAKERERARVALKMDDFNFSKFSATSSKELHTMLEK